MSVRPCRLAALVLTLTAALAIPSSAAASPLTGPFAKGGSGVYAFADSRSVPGEGLLESILRGQAPTLCKRTGGSARRRSYSRAQRDWAALVRRIGGRRGMRKLDHSRTGRSEPRAMRAAAAAAASGERGAALAALLRAHQLRSRDPRPLADAAPLLSDLGRASDALALLDAARKRHAGRSQPFSIRLRSIIDNNRGYALIALGRYAQARKALTAASRHAALLREAKINLAAAYTCSGDYKNGAKFFVVGARRQSFPDGDVVGGGDPTGMLPTQPLMPEVLDLSGGRPATLPSLHYPATIAEGDSMWQGLQQLVNDDLAAESAESDQLSAQLQAVLAAEQKMSFATRRRTKDIVGAAQAILSNPDIKALNTQANAAQDDIRAARLDAVGQGGVRCDRVEADHARELGDTQQIDSLYRQIASLAYQRVSGLAANVSNQTVHDYLLALARNHADSEFWLLVSQDQLFASMDHNYASCGYAAGAQPQLESGQTSEPAVAPCLLKGTSLGLKLFGLSFSMECESISVTGDIGEGWIKAFVKLKYDAAKGEVSVFAGPSGSVSVHGIGKLGARDGFYITAGSDGIHDGGFRTELRGGAEYGPASMIASDKVDFSFAGIHPIDDVVALF